MRHGKKINHLGRTASHRDAMLANMANSLIEHKRINTTVAKAKALKRYIEPLLTKSKNDTTSSRRTVFAYLQNKEVVSELFREVGPAIADRPGGYCRIIKTGFRKGDGADMAIIELVDFNTLYTLEKEQKKTRRSRRGGTKAAAATEQKVEKPQAQATSEEE
ncbi:MAG: 50S ribosomal protein L17 [Weeksellaceae bacterium]|nr:50S ribosomal protein L17 [Weeksellaceae bacterium]